MRTKRPSWRPAWAADLEEDFPGLTSGTRRRRDGTLVPQGGGIQFRRPQFKIPGSPWGPAPMGRKPGYEDKKAELEARLGG